MFVSSSIGGHVDNRKKNRQCGSFHEPEDMVGLFNKARGKEKKTGRGLCWPRAETAKTRVIARTSQHLFFYWRSLSGHRTREEKRLILIFLFAQSVQLLSRSL